MRPSHWLNLLKLCVSLTALARGWLTWRWDSPIRELIWKEDWWGSIVDWEKFATHSDAAITRGLEVLGISLMASALLPWLVAAQRREDDCGKAGRSLQWTRWLLIPMAAALFLDAFARFISSDYQVGMAFEHTLQWSCPLLLLCATGKRASEQRWIKGASLAALLTFTGHGLYAVGYHPVPLKYQSMTASLLKLSEPWVYRFLSTAGYLDFAAGIGLFLSSTRRIALIYMILWGAATAFARVASGPTLDPWLMETVVRSSHWMILLLIWRQGRSLELPRHATPRVSEAPHQHSN